MFSEALKIAYKKNCSTHPHNIFFQLLSETGLIGIFFYLTILFLTIKELFLFIFNKKKYWIVPMVLLLLFFVIILAQDSVLKPFIYEIF